MALSVFEPTSLSLREAVNRLMEDSFVRPALERNGAAPLMLVDIWDTQEALLVQASIPGASKENLQVNYEKDLLTIKVELEAPAPPENARVLLKERSQGNVSRTFRLPCPVDSEQASAEFKDGVLHLVLPKQESIRLKTIKIN